MSSIAMPFGAYLLSALLLFLSHAVPSAPGVRPALIRRLGRGGFLAIHSTVSAAALGLVVWGFVSAGPAATLYPPMPGARHAAVALMPLAMLLVAARLATPFGAIDAPDPPRGIYRLCRYPGSLGILLWATLHLLATGDARRVVLFATMALIALYAIAKNDFILRRSDDPAAAAFRAATAILPFAAILRGWQRWPAGEIGWRWPAAALLAYGAVLWAHPYLFGPDPAPWLR